MKLKTSAYLLTAVLAAFTLTACQLKQTTTTNKVDEHSAEYALDYDGNYIGTIPCADCSGIKVKLTLNKDKTFVYDTTYLTNTNEHFTDKGNYQIKGSILTLPLSPNPIKLFVGESALFYLNNQGKPSKDYVLDKVR